MRMMLKLRITTMGKNMKPVHPGRILKREREARELSANKPAPSLRVPSEVFFSLALTQASCIPVAWLRN